MKRLPRWVAIAALAMVACTAALAQDVRGADEASRPAPDAIVRVFIEACVIPEGELTAAVDWAVNHGFSPADQSVVDVRPLLGGQAGNVFTMPDTSAPVLLAVTNERRCTVWAERVSGPSLRRAFQQAAAQLATRGARVSTMFDRTIERGGAWRQHLQVRYRRVGGTQDFGIGVVTTVVAAAGSQALHFAPAPPTPPATDADAPAVTR
jgi:hypothetical protein